VGDAAGLVDPITGEGIYYAIRSADLAVRALLESNSCAEDYGVRLRRDFYPDLQFASRISRRFYLGRFLFGGVTARAVQFTRYSPSFRAIMRSLFDGEQPYRGLKDRLFGNLGASLAEIALHPFRSAKSD
jgi:flavin-dependent dehydrogenase